MKGLILSIGLSIITLGTALVFLGVMKGNLFYPGVYVIDLGIVITIVAAFVPAKVQA